MQLLMAGLAHELNTPIGAIRSYRDVIQRVTARLAEILADDVVDEAEIEQLRGLVSTLGEVVEIDGVAVDVISDLVASVRSCWQIDEAACRCVDLHAGLDGMLLLLGHEIKHRIEVVKEYGEVPPVECFPSQVNQVFMNLILNASQAIHDAGTITIRTRLTGATVVVEIADTGSGIEPENLGRIFDTGFTTKSTKSGMGLGLRICKEIIEGQGGRIEVESEPGVGSVFVTRLPRPHGFLHRRPCRVAA